MDSKSNDSAGAGVVRDSRPGRSKLSRFACIGLVVLIGCTFCFDVLHGIRLGEDQMAFQPIYRFRQSLAIAISRLRVPPAGHYLAYRSVINVLSENGFALFGGEPGPQLSGAEWDALLRDGSRVDRAIQAALDVSIDPSLPPDIIRGNELGFADYAYLSFILFGAKVCSFYYFFSLLTFLTCALFVLQFRKSSFLLFLPVIFLAELYFLENYAHGYGIQMGTMSNSRLFSGLSLLSALHVLLLLGRRQSFTRNAAVGAALQSLIFAFLLSCRTEVAWQAAMIIAAGCGVGAALLFRRRAASWGNRLRRLRALWPAAIFCGVLAVYQGVVWLSADEHYAHEPEAHNFWEPILGGIFRENEQLRHEYVGDSRESMDRQVEVAIIRDLNLRNDTTSPIVYRLPDGKLTIDVLKGWGDYDHLARSLTLRIIYNHPSVILEELPAKIREQVWDYELAGHGRYWAHLQVPILFVALGAIFCIVSRELTANRRDLCAAGGLIGTVLVFALATPLISPSALAIGTLFAYLGALALVGTYAASLAVGMLLRQRPSGSALPSRGA